MAEHELNKIVDDDGEVFNLRDSTKQPTADRVTSIRASSSASDDKYPSEKAVASAIESLDVSSVGGAGKYISAISETDGKISATATTMDTTPTANSTNAVTSGGIKTALAGKSDTSHTHVADANDVTDSAAASDLSEVTDTTEFVTTNIGGYSSADKKLYRRPFGTKVWPWIKSKLGISSAVGSENTPVYVDSNGQIQKCNGVRELDYACLVGSNGSYTTAEVMAEVYTNEEYALVQVSGRVIFAQDSANSVGEFRVTMNTQNGTTAPTIASKEIIVYGSDSSKWKLTASTGTVLLSGNRYRYIQLYGQVNGGYCGLMLYIDSVTVHNGRKPSGAFINYYKQDKSAATSSSTAPGTELTKIQLLRKDGGNSINNNDGTGTVATMLNNTEVGTGDISSDNVYIMTSNNAGVDDGKWYKRKISKLWSWITSHYQVAIYKPSADVYVRVGADADHCLYLDYDAVSGSTPVMGLWARWSNSNAKWMAQCDASGNCTFNGNAATASDAKSGSTLATTLSGKMNTSADNAASGALQNLTAQLTEGTSDFTDGTELYTSYAGNSGFGTTGYVNTPFRRKASSMWNYINSKLVIERSPASVGTDHKRIKLGYGSYGSNVGGYCCYLVHIFFNLVGGTLAGKGVTVLVSYDWRETTYQSAKCQVLNDNSFSDTGYRIVLAKFLSDNNSKLHLCLGLVNTSAPTTLVGFAYSYCKIMRVGYGLNWTESIASDNVGTYNSLIPATYFMETDTNYKIKVVSSLPSSPDSNTIYFV